MKRLSVMGAVFLNSRVISPPISGSFGIILARRKAEGRRHPPPLKLWRTGKAGRMEEVSHEATKSTKEGEDGQGKRHPPPLKLWRTGKAVRRR
jgi:hypothetical protein